MSHDQFPAGKKTPETTPEHQTEFGQSVERLVRLVDEPDGAMYFRAQWDGANQGSLVEAVRMEAHPTGARKQENRGSFAKAQFKLIETFETGETQERFVWLHTPGFQRPGTPIEIDKKRLAEDYGYQDLNLTTVVQTLAPRAQTIDEYSSLVEALRKYKIEGGIPGLVTNLDRISYQLVYERPINADEFSEEDLRVDRQALFKIVETLKELGSSLTRDVQGRLLTRLLRAISWRDMRVDTEERVTVQDEAAATLREAMEVGIIPPTKATLERVLGNYAIYRYPFATELLYENLPQRANLRNIFGIKRAAFVRDYMTVILAGRLRGGHGDEETQAMVSDYLEMALGRIGRPRDRVSFDSFLDLAETIETPGKVTRRKPEVIEDEDTGENEGEAGGEDDDTLDAASLSSVAPAFAQILSKLQSDNPETARQQVELDRKSCAIVGTLLWPMVMRKIAKPGITSDKD